MTCDERVSQATPPRGIVGRARRLPRFKSATGAVVPTIGIQHLEFARSRGPAPVRSSMTKLFCGILALVLMAGVAAKAGEPPTFEVRKRDAAGELRPIQIPFRSMPEKDGMVVLTFNAPESGTYAFIYTSGPDKGKVAKVVDVAQPGGVTTEVPTRAQKD